MRAASLLLPLIYVGFISLGLPDGAFGVAWPAMHRDLALPIGFGGVVVALVTVLSALSGFSSGAVMARFRTGPVVLVSCGLTGSALLIIGHADHVAWLLVAGIPLGLGAGAVDAGLNGYVARHYSGRHMSWLHACWGLGATIGPLFMARALRQAGDWQSGYVWLGSSQLGLAAMFLVTLGLWSAVPERTAHEAATALKLPLTPSASANSAAGWLSAAIFALYVAVEGTSGVWASSILVESRGFEQAVAGLCTAAFYAAITVGRILIGYFVDRWGNRRATMGGVVLALIGAGIFTAASTPFIAGAALVVLGFGFAPVYPCLMHEVPRRFAPEAVQTVIGRQSGAAYVGAALVPTAAGALAHLSLEAITWLIVAGVAGLGIAIRRLDRMT